MTVTAEAKDVSQIEIVFAELLGGLPLLMAGHELDAIRAPYALRRPAPRHIGANGVAASRHWVSRLASLRVVCVHHSVIIYLATRRIRLRLLFCH
jgi:hypothetical protein